MWLKVLKSGYRIPIMGGFYMKRWVKPDEKVTQQKITKDIQQVCLSSIGNLLPHPVVQGKSQDLEKKIVLMVYNKQDYPVMFHMSYPVNQSSNDIVVPSPMPIYHLGLLMVAGDMMGKGLQNFSILNICFIILSHFPSKVIFTDVADNPTGYRIKCHIMESTFPDYRQPWEKPLPWQLSVAKHVFHNHREDMGISSKAKLLEDTFVVKHSNEQEGGGSFQLCSEELTNVRISRNSQVNEFLASRIDRSTYDELFWVSTASFYSVFKIILKRSFGRKI